MSSHSPVPVYRPSLDFPESAFRASLLQIIFKNEAKREQEALTALKMNAIRSNFYLTHIREDSKHTQFTLGVFLAEKKDGTEDTFRITVHKWGATYSEDDNEKNPMKYTNHMSQVLGDVNLDDIIDTLRRLQTRMKNKTLRGAPIWVDWPTVLPCPIDTSASIHVSIAEKIINAGKIGLKRAKILEEIRALQEFATIDFPMP